MELRLELDDIRGLLAKLPGNWKIEDGTLYYDEVPVAIHTSVKTFDHNAVYVGYESNEKLRDVTITIDLKTIPQGV